MAVAGLQRMLSGCQREKASSDLKEPKLLLCLSTTGFAGNAPSPQDSGTAFHDLLAIMTLSVPKKDALVPSHSEVAMCQNALTCSQQHCSLKIEFVLSAPCQKLLHVSALAEQAASNSSKCQPL